MPPVHLHLSPPVPDGALNALFAAAWPGHSLRAFQPVLERSLLYVCAYAGDDLVGFVNVAWDGGQHGFLLDTCVHPALQRQGVGSMLVRRAVDGARQHRLAWLHVDFERHLREFYVACGFRPSEAGVLQLHG